MFPHSRMIAVTQVFALLWMTGMPVGGRTAPLQNDESKIARLREKALTIPLQRHLRVSLQNGGYYLGRLTEAAERGIEVLILWDHKVETRYFSYEEIRALSPGEEDRSTNTLRSRIFRVWDGSLVELRLRSKEKLIGVIEDYLDNAIVFRFRTGNLLTTREVPLAEVKSFSVKSEARATVRSDPKAIELIRDASIPGGRASKDDPAAAIPVVLRLLHTVSTVDAVAEDRVDFEVINEVKAAGRVVVPKGGSAWGKVVDVVEKRSIGRGARVRIALQFVRTQSGEMLPLAATSEAGHGGQSASVIAGMAAIGTVVFVPLAPVGLLTHGSDTTIPKGTMLIAYLPQQPTTGKSGPENPF